MFLHKLHISGINIGQMESNKSSHGGPEPDILEEFAFEAQRFLFVNGDHEALEVIEEGFIAKVAFSEHGQQFRVLGVSELDGSLLGVLDRGL